MASISPTKHRIKDGTEVVLRSAGPTDAEELLYLAKSVFASSAYTLTEPQEFTLTVEQERAWIESLSGPKNKIILVAESDGLLVGMLDFQGAARKRIAHSGTMGMSVRDGWRGKGIGTVLLKELIRWAEGNPQVERIELGVFEPNADAIALYKKQGFQEEGRKVRGVRFSDGQYADEILMCRFV